MNHDVHTLNHLNHLNQKSSPPKSLSRKLVMLRLLSNSALILLMRQRHIPAVYGRTIARYEILRNRNLSEGPRNPHCLLSGKPKFKGKYAPIPVGDGELAYAEQCSKLWRDSVSILQRNRCKATLDALLNMNEEDTKISLDLQTLQNLRRGLRDLTRYYGHQHAKVG